MPDARLQRTREAYKQSPLDWVCGRCGAPAILKRVSKDEYDAIVNCACNFGIVRLGWFTGDFAQLAYSQQRTGDETI